MATYLYLRITDGTTTITFANGTTATPGDYSIDPDWAPVIVGPDASLLGDGWYPPVQEEIPINVTGSDSATMRANVHALCRLLEQADRWARGDMTLSPVRLQYIPAGSSRATSSPYEALILTSDAAQRNALQLPKNWLKSSATRFTLKAPLRFLRDGAWLNETDTVSSSATASSSIWSITFTDHPVRSPVLLQWTIPNVTGAADYGFGSPLGTIDGAEYSNQLLITSDSASDIIIQACTGLSGTGYATSGSTLVFTAPTTTQAYQALTATVPSGLNTEGIYAVYLNIIPASGISVSVSAGVSLRTDDSVSTPTTVVPTISYTAPTPPAMVLLLGVIAIPPVDALDGVFVSLQSSSAALSATIRSLVFVRLSDDVTVHSIPGKEVTISWGTTQLYQRIDHRLMTALSPTVDMGRVATLQTAINYQGTGIVLQRGTNLSGVWIAGTAALTAGGFSGPFQAADSTSTVYNSTMSATRRRAYLVPE